MSTHHGYLDFCRPKKTSKDPGGGGLGSARTTREKRSKRGVAFESNHQPTPTHHTTPTHNPQPATHNPQPTTHNAQHTTHNPQPTKTTTTATTTNSGYRVLNAGYGFYRAWPAKVSYSDLLNNHVGFLYCRSIANSRNAQGSLYL